MRKSDLDKLQQQYIEQQALTSHASTPKPTHITNRTVRAVVRQDVTPLQSTSDLIEQTKDQLKSRLASGDLKTYEFTALVRALKDIATAEVSVRQEARDTVGQMSGEELKEFVRKLIIEGTDET